MRIPEPTVEKLDFTRLRTPPEHGDVLIEPSGQEMAALAETNHALLRSYSFPVIDQDARQVRAEVRGLLCDGSDGPTVLAGHQPELIHSGVWAKHVVVSTLASRLGGQAINLVVDSDAPKDTALRVWTRSEGRTRSQPVRYAEARHGVAYEGMPALARDRVMTLASEVERLMGDRYGRSFMPRFFAELERSAGAGDWVDQVVAARAAVERDLSVELTEHRVSRVWFGPLLADLLLQAERFAACYNASLAEYRAANKVRSVNRPIPDLVCEPGRCEVPVWAYRIGQPRRRVFVERSADAVDLWAGREQIGSISAGDLSRWDTAKAALASAADFVFRPRALSLTLWARLFVCDLFIHGIGGAKYDRITDGIIRRYYGVGPPGMACVSATLRMENQGPRPAVAAEAVQRARWRVRDVQHNPQRYVRPTPVSAESIQERERLVSESMDLRRREPGNRRRRRSVFGRIRDVNARLLACDPDVRSAAQSELDTAGRRLAECQEADRRDYFFAMLDRASLKGLRDRLALEAAASS